MLRRSGDLEGAVEHLRAATKLEPKQADYHSNLAIALRSAGQHDAAIAAAELATRLAPDNARYHFNLGVAHRSHDDPASAIGPYTEATRLDPSLSEAFWDLGLMHQILGHRPEAIAALNRFLVLTRGADKAADARVEERIRSLGGTPAPAPR